MKLKAERAILVTGATGFVGKQLVARLLQGDRDTRVSVAVRRVGAWDERVSQHIVADLAPTTDWSVALEDIFALVHCAARVHVMNETASDPLSEFRRTNVAGTIRLGHQAAAAGVRRFVFISSIKVNGEANAARHPFSAEDIPAPEDPYGISKLEAERGLQDIASRAGMELVIVRPPLVYGPGVRANFATMIRWLQLGVPLPLGAIHNRRSLVALDNLVDLVRVCLTHPKAAGQTFLVSDGEDVSTTELLRRMGRALGRPARLVPVPVPCLRVVAALLGKRDMARRLCDSLQVDIRKTQNILGWSPPVTMDQTLRELARKLGDQVTP